MAKLNILFSCVLMLVGSCMKLALAQPAPDDRRGAEHVVETAEGHLTCTEEGADRDPRISAKGPPGQEERTITSGITGSAVQYSQSIALLVGQIQPADEAAYARLPSIENEHALVTSELVDRGFKVIAARDLTAVELEMCFSSFFREYGYEEKARILVLYSGHGESVDNRGYLIATDTPNKDAGPNFFRNALNVSRIISLADEALAEHVLMLFDSCFSGHAFDLRPGWVSGPAASGDFAGRARYVITTGGAGQTVPARSAMVPALMEALAGAADNDEDGVITGSELGPYVRDYIRSRDRSLTPQRGVIGSEALETSGEFLLEVQHDQQPQKTINFIGVGGIIVQSTGPGEEIAEQLADVVPISQPTLQARDQTQLAPLPSRYLSMLFEDALYPSKQRWLDWLKQVEANLHLGYVFLAVVDGDNGRWRLRWYGGRREEGANTWSIRQLGDTKYIIVREQSGARIVEVTTPSMSGAVSFDADAKAAAVHFMDWYPELKRKLWYLAECLIPPASLVEKDEDLLRWAADFSQYVSDDLSIEGLQSARRFSILEMINHCRLSAGLAGLEDDAEPVEYRIWGRIKREGQLEVWMHVENETLIEQRATGFILDPMTRKDRSSFVLHLCAEVYDTADEVIELVRYHLREAWEAPEFGNEIERLCQQAREGGPL